MSKDILISAINAVERPLFFRYGFGWKGAEWKETTKEELLGIVERGNYAHYDIKSEPDRWCINFYSSGDME